MNSFNKPVELRGHHLTPLQYIHGVSREEYFRSLNEDPCREDTPRKTSWVPYVTSLNDAFMKVGYDDLKAILKNPLQRIVLIADKPDFICSACPQRVKTACVEREIKQKVNYATFDIKQQLSEDIKTANDFGLDVGVSYTARQIKEALGL